MFYETYNFLQADNALRASKSPVKKALMLRPPTSQTLSDMAALQKEKAQLSQQMKQECSPIMLCYSSLTFRVAPM